jgi:hypothetical protein
MGVWRRIRESWRESKRREDEETIEKFEAQREANAQEASQPPPLPGFRDRIGRGRTSIRFGPR